MEKNVKTEHREIVLKEVIGQSVKTWKRCLIVGAALALILGFFKFIPTYKLYNNDAQRSAYIAKNDNKVVYLTKNVEDLEYEIKKQEQYFNNSIYININPLQEQKGVISYYISTPQTGYQFDYAEDVVHAYKNLFVSGEVISYVKANLSYDIDEKYLDEIITVVDNETDVTANYLDITIVHSNEAKLKEIMALVNNFIEKKEISIRSQVGQYSIILVSNNTAVVTDEDIKVKRTELDTVLDTLEASLSAKESQLKASKNNNISQNIIVKNTVVYALAGFALGVVIFFACQTIFIIWSNKIISSNQLRNYMGISVLGDFVKKKKPDKLERFGYKLVGENINTSFDDVLKITAYNMVSLTDKKDIVIIDLVENDFSAEVLEKVTDFDFAKDISFAKGTKTLESFEMLEHLKDTTAVVFIAKKVGTKVARLEREIDIANIYNCELVGVICI